MKVLVQKVSRATVEVDGLVESRIGVGMVLHLAVTVGSTTEDARKLAEKVMKLKLWPELADQDTQFKSTVAGNGYEIMVVLQQSLNATFPSVQPREQGSMEAADAQTLVEAFTKFLVTEYQEEMVVCAPLDTPMRLETASDTPSLYELDSRALGATPKPAVTKAAVVKESKPVELEPDVGQVTKALRQIPLHPKSKATLETCRVFRVLSMKQFLAGLTEAVQAETDAFAEALEGAAGYFSAKQLDQIMSWTGLTIVAAPKDDDAKEELGDEEAAPDDMGRGDLDEQLAQLQEEVVNPEAAQKRKRMAAVKQELEEPAEEEVARTRPDWRGKAAPETPAAVAAARQWVQSRAGARQQWNQGKGGKGWGKSGGGGPRPWRSWGIASLDTSARLHGEYGAGGYKYGQFSKHGDHESKYLVKDEDPEFDEEDNGRPKKRAQMAPPRRPKGTPTLAPMTPAPGEAGGEAGGDL